MPGFEYRGQISGAQDPVTIDVIINDEVTVTVGDAVYSAAGLARLATSATDVLGIVVGIVDANGIDLDNTSADNYDGTWTSSSQTYVATDDNSTDAQVRVKVCPDPFALWYNDADGDFTDPTDYLRMGNLITEAQLDETTFTDEEVGQFHLWKLDPDGDADDSKCLVHIARWQGSAMEPEASQ